jgi:carboxyl-terminal processing protease
MKITTDRKVMLLVSAALIVFTLSGALMGGVVAVEGTYSYLKLFNEALYLIVNNYVQPVQLESLMEGAYRGLLEALDPDNEYLSPAEFEMASRGGSAGPAEVGLALSKRRGYIVVVAVSAGSPGAEAGIRTGDVVITIDGRPTRVMGTWEASQALRGKPGTTTTLTLNALETPRTKGTAALAGAQAPGREILKLPRRVLASLQPAAQLVEPDAGVARIASIREGDARRLDQVIATLKGRGAKRLLLDLRGCASDSLAEAIGMASLFIEKGTVVTVTDRQEGDKAFQADGRRIAWRGPLAVLVDEGTARTCEILAASLRDTMGTPVLGQKTWGSGTLQKLIPLQHGDGLLLAVGKFLSPAGKDWNGKGLQPDFTVEGDLSDAGDPQRQKAIDYLRGQAPTAARDAA